MTREEYKSFKRTIYLILRSKTSDTFRDSILFDQNKFESYVEEAVDEASILVFGKKDV